ncbi:nitrate/nitrite transporter NrtS [Parasphingopyxis algicola]|uniref:nitrate/nitrite transporter NrtS n=1 Tax=Parasphingopyxis algicola TaxID=2026624 RepID=UPI0015A2A067|nr:nitrate/nitrite transporter NrtS [Parasphingopyxis algicola]QLC26426.1 nitrate/nitrite transporter NrtS [Parasphingopyxis algicola]
MRVTVARAIKVGLIVGTLLVLLNHGDGMAIGEWPPWWKVVLTYLVPYSVSSYSTAAFLMDLSRRKFRGPMAERPL